MLPGDNVLGFIDDVDSEDLCSTSCLENELCKIYTYHRANSTLFSSTCYLLSELGMKISVETRSSTNLSKIRKLVLHLLS